MSECGGCLIGDCNYVWKVNSVPQETILHHLLLEHNIVIASIETVYSISKYCSYWSHKINSGNIEQFLHGINVHSDCQNAEAKSFYMLNDTSNEDRVLRFKLHQEKLQEVLKQQQIERDRTNFKIQCLFCPDFLHGNRFTISSHFFEDHSFSLGHPDNVVFTEQFIERLRQKMNKFECLYCDKVFRDYKTLREHMRKKLHKRLNPSNTEFDKFYVINYREFGKTWKDLGSNDKEEKESKQRNEQLNTTEDWDDWRDQDPDMKCLICNDTNNRLIDLKKHMLYKHFLDFDEMTSSLSYYKQVKLVNYIRYKIHDDICPFCHIPDPDIPNHLITIQKLPETLFREEVHSHQYIPENRYDDEQYLFPSLDNDYLLCCLHDNTPPTSSGPDMPLIIPDTDIDIPDARKLELSRSLEREAVVGGGTTT